MSTKSYSGFLFIGDCNLSDTAPGCRSGDYLDAVLSKIKWALDKSLELNLKPVFLGTFTKKKFELNVFYKLISVLSGYNALIFSGSGSDIEVSSTIGILKQLEIIDCGASTNGSIKASIDINGIATGIKYIPKSMDFPASGDGSIIVTNKSIESSPKIGECPLVVSCFDSTPDHGEMPGYRFISTGKLARRSPDCSNPVIFTVSGELSEINLLNVPCEEIEDLSPTQLASDITKAYKSSEFARLIQEESIRASKQQSDENYLANELNKISLEMNLQSAPFIILSNLLYP
jgi:hypothetical protein